MRPGFNGIILVLFSLTAYGQYNSFKNYSQEIDIPSNLVYNTTQDSLGRMWFLTGKGLLIYDGAVWELLPDSLGLPNHEFGQIADISGVGIVAAGLNNYNQKVVAVLANGKWSNTYLPGDNSIYDRYFITISEKRPIVIHASNEDIYHLDLTTLEIIKLENPLNPEKSEVRKIVKFGQKIIIITKKGLLELKGKKLVPFDLPKELNLESIPLDLTSTAEGDTLVIMEPNALKILIRGKLYEYNEVVINSNYFFDFSDIIIRKGLIFFHCTGPLHVLDIETELIRRIDAHGDIKYARWNKVIIDRQDNIWITSMRGISKVSSLAFHNHNERTLLPDREVSTIVHLPDDLHFIGQVHSFSILKGTDSLVWKYEFPKEKNNRIMDAIYLKGKVLAAASTMGILEIDIKSKVVKQLQVPRDIYNGLSLSGDTLYLVGNGRIYSIWKGQVLSLTKLSSVRKSVKLANGELWFLSRHGAHQLPIQNEGKWNFSYADSLNTYHMAIYNGETLLATMGGLHIMKNGQIRPKMLRPMSPDAQVYALETDNDGLLWIGTSEGIYSIKGDSITGHFRTANGLIGNEINRSALKMDQYNRLWIGTDEGLTILSKRYLRKSWVPPTIYISRITARSKELSLKYDTSVPFDDNDIEVYFGAGGYMDEKSMEYRYRLTGLEKEWNYSPSSFFRYVRYNYLLNGNYQFEVQAREMGGRWSAAAVSPTITILKPFYLQLPFVLAVILIILSLIFIIVNFISERRLRALLQIRLEEKMKEVYAAQQELQIRNIELEQLNEELDTLVYSITHDLRAPILSSMGLINIYRLENNSNEKERFITLIEKSMNRLDHFINNILKITRNAKLGIVKSDVDLSEIIDSIIESQKHRDEAIGINFSYQKEPYIVTTDGERISIILTNLISNAIIYSDPRKDNPTIKIKFSRSEENTVIEVWDNGKGIRSEYLNSVFDIFTRATDDKPGSGLGLYIGKQIAHKLGGDLTVESVYGQWTSFRLVI